MIITAQAALKWKKQYEENPEATIESLALDNHVSKTTMQVWLKKVDTKMRSPGRNGIPNKIYDTDGIKGESDRRIKQVGLRKNYTGHRRGKKF